MIYIEIFELQNKPKFGNDFDEEDLDRDVLEWIESVLFDLLLWEDFELHELDFVFPPFTLLFELHGFSGSEHLVSRRGLAFLMLDTISDLFLTWGLLFWNKYFSGSFSNFLSEL